MIKKATLRPGPPPIPPKNKECPHGCEQAEYLKVDNFLAEYSGNPAPVLKNLGVYDEIEKAAKKLKRLVSISRTDNIVTITDEKGDQVSFKVLGGNYEYILDHFAEEVVKIANEISEQVVNEFAPGIADTEIEKLAPGIAEEKINELVPDIADDRINQLTPGIADERINELAPGIAEEKINELVPEMAKEIAQEQITNMTETIAKDTAEKVIEEIVPDIAKDEANKLIDERVPDMATDQATLVVEDYLSWNIYEDEDVPVTEEEDLENGN